MNTIKFEQDGVKVELERPEPILQEGKWWEFREFRKPKANEFYLGNRNRNIILKAVSTGTYFESWIVSEIPKPTPEQLKAIGMKLRDERPMKVKLGNVAWSRTGHQIAVCNCEDCKHERDHYRWILVPDVREVKNEPRFTIDEIKQWIYHVFGQPHDATRDLINDPKDGIIAVVGRGRK